MALNIPSISKNVVKKCRIFLHEYLYGCKDNSTYYYISDIHKIEAKGTTVNNQEQGTWSFSNIDGFYCKGNFKNGFRVDDWMYVFKTDTINIHWKIFEDNKKGIKFNYPDNWNFQTLENMICAFFDSTYINYFCINFPNIDTNSTKSVLENYMQQYHNEVKKYGRYNCNMVRLKNNQNQFIYFNYKLVKIHRNIKLRGCFLYLDSKIIDIGFSLEDRDSPFDQQIFYDIISTMLINNKRLINPLIKTDIEKFSCPN